MSRVADGVEGGAEVHPDQDFRKQVRKYRSPVIGQMTRLRAHLIAHPHPQSLIAQQCHIHPSMLSKYSLGRVHVPLERLVQLSEILDCPIEALQGYVSPEDFAIADRANGVDRRVWVWADESESDDPL